MNWLALPAALLLAGSVTFLAVPLCIELARRTDFYDLPAGYKRHSAATPYLGGVAVFLGIAVAGIAFGAGATHFAALLCGAALLFMVGTVDDRVALPPRGRILAEVAAAALLCATGHGWDLFSSALANDLVTVIWIVGVVNAFNLMDNLDGAAATVAGVSGAGAAAVAAIGGDHALAALSLALAGSCAGFLPHNLSRPARIFLGDGGSMPIGFLVAAISLDASQSAVAGGRALLVAATLAGLAILDTTLVVVSRIRAGIPLVTPGRDHLTHRLLTRLGSPRKVAAVLATAQAGLCGIAIAGVELGVVTLEAASAVLVGTGIAVIARLERAPWLPIRPEAAAQSAPAPAIQLGGGQHAEPVVESVDGT